MKIIRFSSLGMLLMCAACPGVGDMLRMYGYTELVPPSTLLMPGAMVWVQTQHPFKAGTLCTVDMSLGKKFRPTISPTASSQIMKASNKQFDLDVTFLNFIKGDARFKDIYSLKATLDNAVIYELNDVDVLQSARDRDPACAQAIRMRNNAGYKVTMISSALQADVTFSVSWNIGSQLDASGKAQTLEDLAATLGAQYSHANESSIQAKNLVWGIKDDNYLAHLSDPTELDEPEEAGRIIGAEVRMPDFAEWADVGETGAPSES